VRSALAVLLASSLVGGFARAEAPTPGAAPATDDPAVERRALEARLDALRGEPPTARRLAEEARLLHFLGEIEPDDGSRARIREEGLRAASEARELDPDEPAAILWWIAHHGRRASATNPIEAVRIANDVEQSLLRLRALAPDHDHAAADRVLGILYFTAPPFVSLGSMAKAEQHVRDALRRFPTYPGNQLTMAELLARKGSCRLARRGVELALASRDLARFPVEAPSWRRQASGVLALCR
jgi:hypothetical protein